MPLALPRNEVWQLTGTNDGAGRRAFDLCNAPFVLVSCSTGHRQRADEKQVHGDEIRRLLGELTKLEN